MRVLQFCGATVKVCLRTIAFLVFLLLMSDTQLIKAKSDLVAFFRRSAVARNDLKIGIEVERSAVYEENLKPVNYGGTRGYHALLKKLVLEAGWKATDDDKNENIFALSRGESSIFTEADGRLELASKPRRRLINLVREYERYSSEIDSISREFGIRWVSMGWQPFAKNNEITYAPKARGKLLQKYFEARPEGEAQLKKTNSVHVNFGYHSEDDAMQKFQTLFAVAPIISAMFANSPLNCSKFTGFLGNRLRVGQNFAPERTRVREEFFKKEFDFEKWVDFVCDLPMISIERSGNQIVMEGKTFAEFIQKGHGRHHARLKDFVSHMKSCWTELKMKNWLEFRSIDCVPPHLLPAIPALIRGITQTSASMTAARNLVKKYSFSEYCEVRDVANKSALAAELPDGRKMLTLAKELLEIANTSLKEHHLDKRGNADDSRLLWPIKEYVFVREQSPAEFVMEKWSGEWRQDPHKLLEWSES